MDKLTIYNSALSLISAAPYQPGTGVQHPCDLWYPHALRKANERADWSFARRFITLTANQQNNTPANYSQFTLPADCLKIREVYYHGTQNKTAHRELCGRTLITDTTPAVDLAYTTNIIPTLQELPDNEPTFTQAVIHLLAFLISPHITGKLHTEQAELAEQEFHKATYLDAAQTRANDNSPLIAIRARSIY